MQILRIANFLIAVGVIVTFSGCEVEVLQLTLGVRHRLYPKFYEEHTVKMGEKFQISDTEYYAKAVKFVPDFVIDTQTGKVGSRSREPNNPAVKVIVYKDGEKVDEVWAFKGFRPPHFSRTSFLTFQLIGFRLKGPAPREKLEAKNLKVSN